MGRDKDEDSTLNLDSDVRSFNFHLSRTDNELFVDDSYKPNSVIRVKRYKTKKMEDWNIYQDNKIALTLKGARLNNSEKEYLRSAEGIVFLLQSFKSGARTFAKIKELLKEKLK
jgi:hypothetical protein